VTGDDIMRDVELRAGHRIPTLGLGTWALHGDPCRVTVQRAIEFGYTHIDTADMYGNHQDVGDAMAAFDHATIYLVARAYNAIFMHYASLVAN
jgi:2,5-diketo-D-gluconate reductase A